jgi:hypothetical protein
LNKIIKNEEEETIKKKNIKKEDTNFFSKSISYTDNLNLKNTENNYSNFLLNLIYLIHNNLNFFEIINNENVFLYFKSYLYIYIYSTYNLFLNNNFDDSKNSNTSILNYSYYTSYLYNNNNNDKFLKNIDINLNDYFFDKNEFENQEFERLLKDYNFFEDINKIILKNQKNFELSDILFLLETYNNLIYLISNFKIIVLSNNSNLKNDYDFLFFKKFEKLVDLIKQKFVLKVVIKYLNIEKYVKEVSGINNSLFSNVLVKNNKFVNNLFLEYQNIVLMFKKLNVNESLLLYIYNILNKIINELFIEGISRNNNVKF